jgi:hypothetical protein
MRARWWWLRLQVWQWLNAWRVQPARRAVSPLAWFLGAIVVPAGISLGGTAQRQAALEWILSLDIPLALLLAVQVGSTAVALASRANMESWISPRLRRGLLNRVLRMVRWLRAVRWAVGLVMAASILAWGDGRFSQSLAELLLLSFLGVAGGALFAWNVIGRPKIVDGSAPRRLSRVRGWSVLSAVPFQQTSRQLDARRVAFLTAPVMLAAPMGSLVQQIAAVMAAWVLLLYVSTWMREASRTVVALRRWMPRSGVAPLRLHWLVWRYVILAALSSLAVLWVGWRVSSPGFTQTPS